MDRDTGKVSDISEEHYSIIGYCPGCAGSHIIKPVDFPDYMLKDIYLKMKCPNCNAVGIDFSIVKKKSHK